MYLDINKLNDEILDLDKKIEYMQILLKEVKETHEKIRKALYNLSEEMAREQDIPF